ncbi:MAG: hypothetical protein WBM84_11395, partial [Sedimenticolaceae bacterium]
INDWIRIAGPDGEHQLPIIDNTASAGLRLAADAGYRPGRRIEVLRDIPAGYHELAVNAARHDLLVGVAGDVPRLPLTVLPRLNPYVVRRVLAGSELFAAPDKSVDQSATVEIRVVGSCGHESPRSLPAALAAGSGNGTRPITTAPSTLWFAALRRYRTGLPLAPASATGPQDVEVAGALRRRLDQLLWDAEQTPQRYEAILAEAERLAETQPDAPGIEPLLRRLRRQATWQLVRSAQDSAGIRLVEFSGWQPESPAMQIRKAIIAMPDDKEQLLSGHDSQVLTLYNRAPVTIGMRLSIAGVGHRPLQPMRVLVAWDDQPPTEVELSATQPEVNLREHVAAGDHAVRLRILEPLANQYVRIKVDERRGGNSRVIAEPVQRSYMLATRDQPLVLLQRGPSRLRIDEWRDGQTRVSYRTLEAGWQQVVIPVSGERDEALLRVFRRSIATGRREVAIGQTLYQPVPVGAPLWPAMPTIELIETRSVEPFVSAWPDDATWSFTSGLTSRRTLDDEPGGASAAQRFASLGATYRRFSERDATYYHADGAVRLHEHGAPTLALRGYVGVRRPDWPVELDVAARVFLQHVDATGDVESAATVRAGVARTLRLGDKVTHRPSLTLFQRWLSLDSLPKGDRAEIDQDIFTDYKQDHRRGLRLGERVQYRPSLDTLLHAGANLVSNEDLNLIDPDHASVDLGARQLRGDLDLGVRFKHFEYFSDDDRAQGSDTQRLQLEVGFSRWLSPHRGLQAGLVYEYDTKSGDASVALSLSLSRANGRYYQDFRPSDLDFRQLRQRKTLEKMATEGW